MTFFFFSLLPLVSVRELFKQSDRVSFIYKLEPAYNVVPGTC